MKRWPGYFILRPSTFILCGKPGAQQCGLAKARRGYEKGELVLRHPAQPLDQQRRELGWEIGADDLEELLRPAAAGSVEAFELVGSQVAQRHTVRQRIAHQFASCVRQ